MISDENLLKDIFETAEFLAFCRFNSYFTFITKEKLHFSFMKEVAFIVA